MDRGERISELLEELERVLEDERGTLLKPGERALFVIPNKKTRVRIRKTHGYERTLELFKQILDLSYATEGFKVFLMGRAEIHASNLYPAYFFFFDLDCIEGQPQRLFDELEVRGYEEYVFKAYVSQFLKDPLPYFARSSDYEEWKQIDPPPRDPKEDLAKAKVFLKWAEDFRVKYGHYPERYSDELRSF